MRSEAALLRWAVFSVAFVMMAASWAAAQSDRGRISGLVKDESGAPVPGVSVTATNTGTNVVTATTTNSHGLYSVPNLPIGTYSVSFSLEAFTPYTREGIEVGLAEAVRLDHTLTVGTLRTAVTVRVDTDLLTPIGSEAPAIRTIVRRKLGKHPSRESVAHPPGRG
jgi:hypothetical protein